MNYFDVFRKRVQLSGVNATEASKNITVNSINRTFSEMLNYQIVKINDIDTEVVVNEGKTYKEKKLILKPNVHFDIGSLVDYKDEKWLVTDKYENQISDSLKIELCNGEMIFQTPPTRILIGVTPWGEEQYQEIPSSTITIPCIVQSVRELYDGDSEQINVVDTRIALKIQNQSNEYIEVGKDFEIFGTKYRIYGIDRSQTIKDKGVLIVLAEKL
jgi:hypothetical protein